VLIVDDSSVSSRVAGRKLEARDFCVTCVYNGQQAFEVVTLHPTLFDVLLVDVVMPVCDGMELLRMLKSEPKLMHLPVIMLSGLDGEELARNCLALGAASLMKKPFDDYHFSQLSAAIFGGDSAKSP
jgi:two-component system cell cycle response regulator